MVSPVLINELRVSFTRTVTQGTSRTPDATSPGNSASPGSPREPVMSGFPRINVRDYTVLARPNSQPFTPTANTYNYADTVTWVKGRHLMKFGGDAMRAADFQPFVTGIRGDFTFLGRWTNVPPLGISCWDCPRPARGWCGLRGTTSFRPRLGAFSRTISRCGPASP